MKTNMTKCELCYTTVKQDTMRYLMTEDDGYRLLCPKCRVLFYVLSVEPGAEEKIKREITLRAKQSGLWKHFGKILIPKEFKTKITKDKYLAHHKWGKFGKATKPVSFKDPTTGKTSNGYVYSEDANDALWEAKQKFGDHFDVTHVELVESGGRKLTHRKKSYTGYLIIQMEYTDDIRLLLESLRPKGAWGLLPMKPVLSGTRYASKEPPAKTKPKKWEVEKHEEWRPTAITSEEAAMLLINAESLKGKPPIQKVPFAQGDRVHAISGAYSGVEGTIVQIGGDEDYLEAKIEINLLGTKQQIVVRCDDLTKL